MEPREVEFEKLVANLRIDDKPDPGHKDRLRWQVLQAYHAAANQPASRSGLSRIRRILMKSSFTKFALAASVIFVIALGLFYGLGGGSIALAQVAEKLEQTHSMSYKIHISMTGLPGMPAGQEMKMDGDVLIDTRYGLRMDMSTMGKVASTGVMNFAEKTMLNFMPEQKKYMRVTLTDDLMTETQKTNGDPRYMVEQFLKSEYTDLGRSVIDGVEVQGFETSSPAITGGTFKNSVARIWVDLRTGYPFQMTIDGQGLQEGSSVKLLVDQYQWNVPTDAETFSLAIPEGFTSMGDISLKGLGSGDELIEALKYFQDLSGGRFPKSLNTLDLTQELTDLYKAKFAAEYSAKALEMKLREESVVSQDPEADELKAMAAHAKALTDQVKAMREPTPEQKQRDQEREAQVLKFTIAATNYQMLTIQNADPKYYGDTVQPGEAGKVLVRWKTPEGNYRVIYGDLRSEEVTAERLAELEAQP